MLKQVRRVIAPVVTKPVDLLVYKEDEFYERAELNTTFEYKIKTEGIKIYEQS